MKAQYSTTMIYVNALIIDKATKLTLPGANIYVKELNIGITTDNDGRFSLALPVSIGKLTFEVSYIGYRSFSKTLDVKDSDIDLGIIDLEESTHQLNEAVIKGKAPIAKTNGEKISFNASAVKVSDDAKGINLIKKLPGFRFNNDKIETQGEQVKKVYVNGKPYFEDDPKNALNALPAEIIQNIELFDDYGEIASFTGYAGGTSVKAINIITKSEYKNKPFGNIFLGYGTDGKYALEGTISLSNKSHGLSLVFDINNVNKSNSDLSAFKSFESQVLSTFLGGVSSEPNSFGEKVYNSLGLNYNGNLKENTEMSVCYVFGIMEENLSQLRIENYQDKFFYNTADSNFKSTSLHKLNVKLISQPANNTKFIISEKAIFIEGDNMIISKNAGFTNFHDINYATTDLGQESNKFNTNTALIWLQNFGNSGRSLTAFANLKLNNMNINRLLISDIEKYGLTEDLMTDTSFSVINQNEKIGQGDNAAQLRISYKEPIGLLSSLNFVYKGLYNWRNMNNKIYVYDPISNSYQEQNNFISNNIDSDFVTNRFEFGFSKFGLDLILNVGLAYENSSLVNSFNSSQKEQTKVYQNFLPVIFGKYYISFDKDLIFYLRSNIILPTVQHLNTSLDQSNSLKVYSGNPDLESGIQHTTMVRYVHTLSEQSQFLSVYSFLRYATNFVGTETKFLTEQQEINGVVLEIGTQLTKPVNLDGYFNLISGVDYSFPVNLIRCNLNTGIKYSFNYIPIVFDLKEIAAKNHKGEFNLALVSNISRKIDFNFANRISYNYAFNSETSGYTEYLTNDMSLDFNIELLQRLQLNAEYQYTLFEYFEQQKNQDYSLLNLNISAGLLKSKKLKVGLGIYDLLNQNKGVEFKLHDTYNEQVISNSLKQHFMLILSYKF